MTDKEQIIIDGVDVSGCENFKPKDRFTCHPYICNCHQKPNCHFKQLARKTQECEELKEKNALLETQMAFNLSEMEIKLGNEINRSETLLKELKRFDKIKDEFREMSEKLKTENTRYIKALEEVEEYCIHYLKHNPKSPSIDLNVILDIINKAKGEGND